MPDVFFFFPSLFRLLPKVLFRVGDVRSVNLMRSGEILQERGSPDALCYE